MATDNPGLPGPQAAPQTAAQQPPAPQTTAATARRSDPAPAAAVPPAGDATVLRTVGLTLSFGTRAVLSDVNADVARGQVTAIIGPTGSGKSTLLRTFNRMNDKVSGYRHAGDVLLDGRSIWQPGLHLMALRQKVGMVFQRPNPFPMSIGDNVIAGPRASKLTGKSGLRELTEKCLSEVGLWEAVKDRLKDSPFRLSGGQQQLLCLARALAVDPDVLLLDEPTSSLDPMATESIESLVRTLVPRLTVVIVTHNLAQANRIADSTIFLNRGRLVEHGPTRQIFEDPQNDETARYVSGQYG
jgi:phosphate transport system ATP-binding protein